MTLPVHSRRTRPQFAVLLATTLVVASCTVNAGTALGTRTTVSSPPTTSPGSATASPSADLISIGAGLSGPAGLKATVFASGAGHVSAIAFDAQGRLWFANADYEDTGTDGVYVVLGEGAPPVDVVRGLHTPLGLLWYGGSLYVSSAGGVVAYSGFDGTRFASVRTVLSVSTGTGEVNGLAIGPDGRMVVGISAPCNACQTTSSYSATIVSFEPDGSDPSVYASGIRAAVGLAFYPGTSQLLVTMNQRDDLGDQTPGDWLAVVSEGQSWGFPDCYGQSGSSCPAVPSPVAVLDTHAAVSGVAIVSGQLSTSVGTAALVAEWAIGTVRAIALTADGSVAGNPATTFLRGLTNPVPVALGPDGGVFVGDWGTGLIYRIAAA